MKGEHNRTFENSPVVPLLSIGIANVAAGATLERFATGGVEKALGAESVSTNFGLQSNLEVMILGNNALCKNTEFI